MECLSALDRSPERNNIHDLLQRHTAARVELRGEPNFGVNHSVRGHVLYQFAGNAREVPRALHDLNSEVDPADVVEQVFTLFGRHQSGLERFRKRQSQFPADLGDSLNPNTAIQVAVEFNFGKFAELAGRHQSPTPNLPRLDSNPAAAWPFSDLSRR